MSDLTEMTYPYYLIVGVVIFLVVMYVVESMNNTVETREFNYEKLNSATSCTELNIFFKKALDFESGFSEHTDRNKITDIFVSKVKELDCK